MLSLQERVVALEAGARESDEALAAAKLSARHEADTRSQLDSRNMELELLLAKLRSRDDSGDFDKTK